MAKFQEVIMKLAETHPNAPLTAARKSILQDGMSRFLSQFQTPDHPPYAAMIERALKELNEKWGSSEDSISKFIEKEYNNLPWAHSTLLKHHLGKLCESGDVLSRGRRYMLVGAVPSLSSSTGHKKKKRKNKWKLNWDWQRQRYKPRKKFESKQKNQQNGDQNKVTEDHKESQGLENHTSESNAGFDSSFLSTEPPSRMEFNEYKSLEEAKTKPQQQEQDKAEDICPELSSQKHLHLEPIRAEPPSRMELSQQQEADKAEDDCQCHEILSQKPPDFELIRVEDSSQLEICSMGDFGPQECPIVTKELHFLNSSSSEKLDSAEGVKLELTNMEHPITQEPLIFRPIKDRSVGPTGLELVSTEEFCRSLRNRRVPEPKEAATATATATSRHMNVLALSKLEDRYSPQLKLSNLESLEDQQKTVKNSIPVTDQRAKLRSYRKQDELEQFDLSKSDGKEVVLSFVNETEKLGAKKRVRKRKSVS